MINKKAIATHWLVLILAFFLGLGAFFYYYMISEQPVYGEYIGEFQLNIIKNFQKGEKVLFYIDQSAKYSLQQAIYDLANNGGHYESPCGSFGGTNIWVTIENDDKLKVKKCIPNDDNLKENFLKIFDEMLRNYLANYPNVYIPASYNYELIGNLEVIGKATDDIVIEIIPKDFEIKPKRLTTTNTKEIYQQAIKQEIQLLRVPMRSNPDIETIKQYHPEVLEQYAELCRIMNADDSLGNPPGFCKPKKEVCCITSGYRHPSYNKEIGGADYSAHQYGVALDIYIGKDIKEQLKWAEESSKLFTRVGIYPHSTYIHVDLMPVRGAYSRYWIGRGGKTLATANDISQLKNKVSEFT